MLKRTEIEYYLDTVWAIADSQYVINYIIGYTSNPIQRRAQYRVNGYPHFVILASGLMREDALKLEKALQEGIKSDKRHTRYRKYCSYRRNLSYRASVGGIVGNALSKTHAVYMAWYEP